MVTGREKKSNKVWCLVYLPNCTMVEFYMDRTCTGFELLVDVCRLVRLSEIFYFGFKALNNASTTRWINLRNRLKDEIPLTSPVRLFLLIKFYVTPQAIQQSITRDYFYHSLLLKIQSGELDVRHENNSVVTRLAALFLAIETRSFALKAPIQEACLRPMFKNFTSFYDWTDHIIDACIEEYKRLPEDLSYEDGVSSFLRVASVMELYGSEHFQVLYFSNAPKMRGPQNTGRFSLLVGTTKLTLKHSISEPLNDSADPIPLFEVPYSDINTVSFKGHCFTVHHSTGEAGGSHEFCSFRMKSTDQSVSIFRVFTEFHTFFYCRTVKPVVARKEWPGPKLGVHNLRLLDIKGVFSKTSFVKKRKYLFDVHCTRRQAYEASFKLLLNPFDQSSKAWCIHSPCSNITLADGFTVNLMPSWFVPVEHTKRLTSPMYQAPPKRTESDPSSSTDNQKAVHQDCKVTHPTYYHLTEAMIGNSVVEESEQLLCQETPPLDQTTESSSESVESTTPDADRALCLSPSRERTGRVAGSQAESGPDNSCAMCLENAVNCAFCPCGHAISCTTCSEQCRRCPVCRSSIHMVQRIYFV